MSAGRLVRERVAGQGGKKPTYRTKLVDSMTDRLRDGGRDRGDAQGRCRQRTCVAPRSRCSRWTGTTGLARSFSAFGPARPARSASRASPVLRVDVRIVYRGTPTNRPLTKEIDIRVRAGITIRPDRGRLRNGQQVAFRGTLRGGPRSRGGQASVAPSAHIAGVADLRDATGSGSRRKMERDVPLHGDVRSHALRVPCRGAGRVRLSVRTRQLLDGASAGHAVARLPALLPFWASRFRTFGACAPFRAGLGSPADEDSSGDARSGREPGRGRSRRGRHVHRDGLRRQLDPAGCDRPEPARGPARCCARRC